jgi:hypothetical protein
MTKIIISSSFFSVTHFMISIISSSFRHYRFHRQVDNENSVKKTLSLSTYIKMPHPISSEVISYLVKAPLKKCSRNIYIYCFASRAISVCGMIGGSVSWRRDKKFLINKKIFFFSVYFFLEHIYWWWCGGLLVNNKIKNIVEARNDFFLFLCWSELLFMWLKVKRDWRSKVWTLEMVYEEN